ncbi:nicotinate-nucleotide--dimethylbenzimidazole phosphoribosyltransferase [Streptomyces sp. 7N604]|uniref:nicotinate-nucleotide--dimethylbenzimidazole phosphoribosyltransferase n=1 Tax=Streptomyces sp. 7N604 TaxID=3457415 RepID=UPI003FD2773A
MTDTGQVPGEGLPENAGGQQETPRYAAPATPAGPGLPEQPGGIPAPGAYAFHDPATNGREEDDLLLMPGAQGAWSEQPQGTAPSQAHAQPHGGVPPRAQDQQQGAVPPQAQAQPQIPAQAAGYPQQPGQEQEPYFAPQPHAYVPPQAQQPADSGAYEPGMHHAQAGTHETGGRDTGSVDYGAVRMPQGSAPQPPAQQPMASPSHPSPVSSTPPAGTPTPARRPLHLGPPVPEASGGVVRSLADRGPAGVRAQAGSPAAPLAGPVTAGPEYLDVPQEVAPAVAVSVAAYAEQAAGVLPGPQLGEIPPLVAHWNPQPPHDGSAVRAENPAGAAAPAGVAESAETVGRANGDGTPAEPSQVQAEAQVQEQPGGPVPAQEPAQVQEPVPAPGPEQAPGASLPDEPPAPVGAGGPRETEAVRTPGDRPGVPDVPEAVGGQPEPTDAQHEPASAELPLSPAVPPQQSAAPADTGSAPEEVAPEAQQPAGASDVAADAGADGDGSGADQVPAQAAESATAQAPEKTAAARPGASAGDSAPEAGTPATWPEPQPQPEAEREAEQRAEQVAEQFAPAEADEGTAAHRSEQEQAPAEPGKVLADELVAPRSVPPQADAEPAPEPAAVDATEPEPEAQPAPTAASDDEAAADSDDAAADRADGTLRAPAEGYGDAEREAVLRVMRERRDIRNGFRSDPVPHDVLLRVLEAAHTAPSVGHSQPWDFVVIRSAETRRTMHELATRQREAYAKSLPKGRAKQFKELKIEAILDTPVNIVVTADPTRGGRHTLGRHTQPQMAPYSSALAVENLWLAARAEGLGVGWVSFFDEREMVRALGLPEHLEVVAYLCVGYVDEFPDEPELMQAGWSKRRPLSWVVHEETYGRRALPGEQPHDLLQETLQGIRPLDAKALGEAWERQKRMTKPAGALGMLEIISAQLSGLSRQCPPPVPEPAAVAIFAGDHGVHAQGVTPWPQEVTAQMVANFLGGGAVCNAFANQVGAEVCVVDVGVAGELPSTPGLLPRKVRYGTGDFTTGPALSREEVLRAIEVGIETARDLVAAGNKALLSGEMGIANTTVSAALISVYTGQDPSEVTGRGTGINDETHARKVDVVRRALELHQPDPADPVGVLAAVGGLEHAAIVGLLLGAASLRTPVILDGVSAGAAALVARAIAPEVLAACIAGHRSAEPGHVAALTKLGLRPLVDLDLRLGEGTGALLALPLVQSAARAMHEVATFDSAGVTEKA